MWKVIKDGTKWHGINTSLNYWSQPFSSKASAQAFVDARKAEAKKKNPKGKVKIVRSTQGYVTGGGSFHPGTVKKRSAVKKAKRAKGRVAAKGTTSTRAAQTFPVGKFVKVDKVRVNKNGTIDVMRTHAKRAVKRPRR